MRPFHERLYEHFSLFGSDYIVYLTLIGSLVVGIVNRRYLNRSTQLVLMMLVVSLLVELTILYFAVRGWQNHFLFTIESEVELIFLSLFYYLEIREKISRRIIGGMLGVCTAYFLVIFRPDQMADHLIGIQRVLLIWLVLLHFRHLLLKLRVPNLLTHAPFWVSVATMLYGAGTMFIFLFNQETITVPDVTEDFLFYTFVNQVFQNLFYALLGFSLYARRWETRPQPAD